MSKYTSAQIVEGFREGSKVRQRTLLDICSLPMEKVLAVKAALHGSQQDGLTVR